MTGVRNGLEHNGHCIRRTKARASSWAAKPMGELLSMSSSSWLIKSRAGASAVLLYVVVVIRGSSSPVGEASSGRSPVAAWIALINDYIIEVLRALSAP